MANLRSAWRLRATLAAVVTLGGILGLADGEHMQEVIRLPWGDSFIFAQPEECQAVSLLQTQGRLQQGSAFQPRSSVLSNFFEDPSPRSASVGGLSMAQAPFDVGNDAVPLSRLEAQAAPSVLAQQPQSMMQQQQAATTRGVVGYTAASVYGPQASEVKFAAEKSSAITPQQDIQQQLDRQAKLLQEDEQRERALLAAQAEQRAKAAQEQQGAARAPLEDRVSGEEKLPPDRGGTDQRSQNAQQQAPPESFQQQARRLLWSLQGGQPQQQLQQQSGLGFGGPRR